MEKFSYRKMLNVAPWIITIIAVTLLIFRPGASAQRPTVINTGRYQLFTGTFYGMLDGKPTADGPGVFKIDTETGATWIYVTQTSAKTSIEGWSPIYNIVRQQ